MRKLIACLSLSLTLAMADSLAAQQPRRPSTANNQFTAGLSYRPQRPRTRPQRTEADLLIHQNAVVQARQRVARIEARKWLGYTPLRPTGRPGWSLAQDFNPPLATGGWYANAGWLWMTSP